MVCGIFITYGKAVLRETIMRSPHDKRLDWNSLFPKPYYILKKGREGLARSGMQTDIILENDTSDFTIVDAKYYAATSAETAPGWPDIGKQMAYETALTEAFTRDNGSKPNIRNVFAFPGNSGDGSSGASGDAFYQRHKHFKHCFLNNILRLHISKRCA